uniref:Uncharacterized protein n=1 Tax=Suricata suricatta TaxID=37032 RepID=A0A673TCK1_SURSU
MVEPGFKPRQSTPEAKFRFDVFILFLRERLCVSRGGVPAHPGQRKKILAEKARQLMDWTKKNGVIRMSDAMFYHFVLETPRNHSVIVMFTSLQFRSCLIIKSADEFQTLAHSWQHSSAFNSKAFFWRRWILMKALRPSGCFS